MITANTDRNSCKKPTKQRQQTLYAFTHTKQSITKELCDMVLESTLRCQKAVQQGFARVDFLEETYEVLQWCSMKKKKRNALSQNNRQTSVSAEKEPSARM